MGCDGSAHICRIFSGQGGLSDGVRLARLELQSPGGFPIQRCMTAMCISLKDDNLWGGNKDIAFVLELFVVWMM